MPKRTPTQRDNELNHRESSEEELARFILDKAGIPVDQFAVAVILETYGIRDADAVKKFGRKDVFDLAYKIYDRCRVILADVPELTVSLTAYNKGKCIGEAIENILCQDGVEFELIVIDDGSEDNTADVVQSFEDRRVKLIRNKSHRGFAYCYNLAVEKTKSPFIAYVSADGIVLPDALQKMIQKLKSSPDIGQVNCYSFHADEDVRVAGVSFHSKTNFSPKYIAYGMDYKRGLLVHGSVTNHLRMYRRDVLIVAGKFDETVKYGLDYDMALRIVDKYDIKLVPELLYCSRIHQSSKIKPLGFKGIVSGFHRLVFSWLFLKDRKINFLSHKEYDLNKLMIVGLYYSLRLTNMLYFIREITTIPGKFWRVINR
ncbi:MAG TPA: glycosyltransferase family 2 protein [Thermodesulfobacteriota bacterium]|nr:glycosyltransferase family 2 protein [Thermodesulfobacteriota bacterium]